MSVSTDDRCGYRLRVGIPTEAVSREPCCRPVWADRDRCVWHARVDGKTSDVLEDASPETDGNLDGAYLRGADLVGVDWFAGRSMVGADLTGANVNGADFSEANLMLATLSNTTAIDADFGGANFEGATFSNADLRRASLEDALLNDAVFADVHVGSATRIPEISVYERELVEPTLGEDHPLEAAAWAYRQLQRIYRSNGLPALARHYYNREKNVRRKLAWTAREYREAIKWELARWVALYGSSPYRVLLTSVVVIVVAAVLYPLTGGIREIRADTAITYVIDDPERAPQWWIATVLFKSLYFSVVTFTTLGFGDIQPVGRFARLLAGVEALLGTLLAALLVFVLARIVTW